MFKLLFVVLAVFLIAVSSYSQIPVTTPTPKPDEDVVKISTHLIQIDVTVTDKNGKVVHDLSPDDFEIYENGKKQNISNFSFISNTQTATATDKPKDKKQQVVALPPSPVRPEQVHRTIALVVDDLSLSFESTYYARRALKKFVDEQMQDGDLVAIIRTGAGMGALQQFTTDKRQLYAAIERVRWNPVGTGNIGAFAPMEGKVDTGLPPDLQKSIDDNKKDFDQFRTSVFATGTLGAINYVVRGMQELPGRKSIMLISDGFKLFEEDHETGTREYGRVLEALRRLVDAANRASVVIYSLDARGLAITGLTAADDTSGRSPDQIESELTDRRNELFDTQDGLVYLAKQTGGTALINNNDLSGGIRRILDDQSYYLIAYVPDTDTFDPKSSRFNNLSVKVKQPGFKVRYRSGFFGTSDEKSTAIAAGPTGRNKLFAAVTSPFGSSQIPVRLNAIFNVGKDNTPYVRSLLHIDLSQLKFEELPNKSKKAVIDVLVIAFGDNGAVVDQSGKSFSLEFPPAVFEKYLREGLVHIFTFPVKKPGAYQLRVAIRDEATDKVGASNQFIEIPNLKKDRLMLSGVVVEDIPVSEWQERNASTSRPTSSTALNDTSTRQFKSGTVLNYAYSVFNAKAGSAQTGNLEFQIKLFRDGKLMFEGKPQKAVDLSPNPRPNAVDLLGSLMLGSAMAPADYVLQITVTDKMADPKHNSASQFVQFEIVQ